LLLRASALSHAEPAAAEQIARRIAEQDQNIGSKIPEEAE
jgi:hypothetical protein